MQDFVSSVVGRRTAQIFFEEFVKVAGVVEANRGRKLGDGGKILLGIHQFFLWIHRFGISSDIQTDSFAESLQNSGSIRFY